MKILRAVWWSLKCVVAEKSYHRVIEEGGVCHLCVSAQTLGTGRAGWALCCLFPARQEVSRVAPHIQHELFVGAAACHSPRQTIHPLSVPSVYLLWSFFDSSGFSVNSLCLHSECWQPLIRPHSDDLYTWKCFSRFRQTITPQVMLC